MKVHGKRAMLNKSGHCSTAAIVAEVEDTGNWTSGCGRDGKPVGKNDTYSGIPDANLQISDCSRSIAMELYLGDKDQYKNSLYKIDTMIAALQAMREGMVIERKRYIQRIKDVKD